MIDTPLLTEAFDPRRVFIGWDTETGEEVYLPLSSYLYRSAELIGESGCGKTDRFVEDMRTLSLTASGWLYYDFAATGFDQAQQWDANLAELIAAGVERPYADTVPEFRGMTAGFIGRHAYATVGGNNPPIRVNPFRRYRFKDGTRETVAEAAERVTRIWSAQYADFALRVQFAWVQEMVSTFVIGGERPITEWHLIIGDDPLYRSFLESEMRRLGTWADPFVQRQVQNLDALHALPPKEKRDTIQSFVNSFQPLAAGAVPAFFSNENFFLEDVVDGGHRLFVDVSGLNNPERKKFVMRVLHCTLDTLINKRRFKDNEPTIVEFIDEIAWLGADFFDTLTRRRNHRSAVLTARQDVRQFESIGFKIADRLSRKSVATQILWDIDTFDDARELVLRMNPIDPDGAWIERMVQTMTTSKKEGSSLSRIETVSNVSTRGRKTGASITLHYDAKGKLSGFSKGEDAGETLLHGQTDGTGIQTGTDSGTTLGASRVRQPFRLSFDEQVSVRSQPLYRKPRRVAIVRCEREYRTVLMRRARQIPQTEACEAIVETYVGINRAIHEARTVVLPPFDRSEYLLSSGDAAPVFAKTRAKRRERETTRRDSPAPRSPAAADATTAPARVAGATRGFDGPRAGFDGEMRGALALDPPPSTTFPPVPMPTPTTDNRSTFILSSAACLRFLTVADVMTLLGSTYDMASRELARLAEADPPLLDTFRPPVGRGQGSVPVIYVLSGNGARVLADAGVANIENLSRIVKNVGTRRRDVEAGNPTQIRHALEITHLVSLLWRGLWDRDPHARLSDVYYDRELNCSLSAADVAERLPTLAEREKLQRSQDGTACAYIPDFFFAVTWSPDGGAQRRDAFALEVETGYGQRDPVSIGTQKAAKIGVLVRDFHRTGKIGPLAFPIAPDFKVLFWVREQPFEEGITQGALSVQRAGKNPIVSTNGELLPLAAPLGTEKKALPASVRELSQRLFTEEIWQFLAYRDTRLSLLDPPIGPVIGTEPGA